VDFHKDSDTVHIRKSKSGKARHLMLTEEGAAFFTELCAGRPGSELMLLKADGSAWAKSHQVPPTARACERARITPPISFHCLRHTWASLAIMSGMPLMAAAQVLGHKDVRMVTLHYGHLSKDHVTEAIRTHSPRFGIQGGGKVVALDRP
jgi:integrase